MRTRYLSTRRRRVLCVSPRYAPSFGTFQYAYPFFGGRVRAFMPPQGLLVVASYLPETWDVRFVDENAGAASDADFQWADAVLVSGMHVQRAFINDIVARAHRHGRVVVLGGPSVSRCPESYPEADLLHVGELCAATDRIIEYLDTHRWRPRRPLRFETATRLPLSDFPVPAYHLTPIRRYFLANIQFSSGCPYSCEFCDIPALYGKNPRLKTPAQVLAELDQIVAGGAASVYFVDDNFIGNQKATAERSIDFVPASAIPILTINILYALPRTPLWRRLEAEGRLLPDEGRESNIAFRMPYESVLDLWLRCITTAYEPAAVYERYVYNVEHTFSNRLPFPTNRERASWRNVLMGLAILGRLFWRVGIRGDYRRTFWKAALPMLRAGELEALINTAVVSHHLIEFTRQCARGVRESSFYAPEAPAPPEALAG